MTNSEDHTTAPKRVACILVVDDRPDARYVTVRALSALYDVRETATGRETLRLAQLPADLIVLDIRLPDMDGFEVCERLKSDPRTRDIPVLMKTAAYSDAASRDRGLAVGAAEFLSEPVEADVLVETVQRLLASRPTSA